MATTVERVILLQTVDVFAEVPTEQLAALAAIAREVTLPPETCIYKEAGVSDAMYIVLSGRVRLARGGNEVSVAERDVAFGTWALFDDELRMVSATTLEETRLLRIDKEDFFELLADDTEVTRAIFRAIVHRLRDLATKVAIGRAGGRLTPVHD